MRCIEGRRLLVFGIAGIALIAFATAGAGALGPDETRGSTAGALTVGPHHVVVHDVTVRVANVHLTGPGLPERSVGEATYTVDDMSVSTGGFALALDDRRVRIGRLSLTVDDVGVTFDNVSIGE